MKQAADKGFDGASMRLKKLDEILQNKGETVLGSTISQPITAKPIIAPSRLDPEAERCLLLARSGNAEAQRRIGLMYWVGKGVPKNLGEAKYWLSEAANQGDKIAQQRLALLKKLY